MWQTRLTLGGEKQIPKDLLDQAQSVDTSILVQIDHYQQRQGVTTSDAESGHIVHG